MKTKYFSRVNPARSRVNIICLGLLVLVFVWLWFTTGSGDEDEGATVELHPDPEAAVHHYRKRRDPTIFVAISAYRGVWMLQQQLLCLSHYHPVAS